MGLSAKRRVFVEHYLCSWNATRAAKEAGYSERTAHVQGCRLLSNANVQEHIKARLAAKVMGTDEVLSRLAEQARAEYADYLHENGVLDLEKMLKDGKGHLIKGTKWDSKGNLVVEFYDAQTALVQIGRAHGMFTDKQEHKLTLGFDLDDWKRQREARRQDLDDALDEVDESDDGAPEDTEG